MKIDSGSETPETIIHLNLTLSQREADVLLTILSRVGGNHDGPRGVSETIARALRKLGSRSGITNNSGSIYLPDTWAAFLDQGR